MRYFYTDTLAALWMRKHFGMRFICADGLPLRKDENEDTFISERHQKIYIRPDSLHLLEPQQEDVVHGKLVGTFHSFCLSPERGWFFRTGNDSMAYTLEGKIIQRKGISFMWPESEP